MASAIKPHRRPRHGARPARAERPQSCSVRGMNDVLPDEAALWERFEDTARDVFRAYGYRNVRVPIVEPTPLFVRGDRRSHRRRRKEMYTFEDRLNGEQPDAAPRGDRRHRARGDRAQPRSTSGRSASGPRARCSVTSVRNEGRYRQFHQFDVEALGFAGPDVDAEQIVMLARLWHALGLADGITLADQLDRRRRRAPARIAPR